MYEIGKQKVKLDKLPRITSALSIGHFNEVMTMRLSMFNKSNKMPSDLVISVEEDLWIYIQKEIIKSNIGGKAGEQKSRSISVYFKGIKAAEVNMQPGRFLFDWSEKIHNDFKQKIKDAEKDPQQIRNLKSSRANAIHGAFHHGLIDVLTKQREEQIKPEKQ